MSKSPSKGRKDHYLPQGYLKGFIDPSVPTTCSKPFWVFDVRYKTWKASGPGSIGYERGFYDFAYRQGDRQHADDLFAELENGYPDLVGGLRTSGFAHWREHLPLLLRYMQMMRCRSPLFREQFMQEWAPKRAARVISVDREKSRVGVDSLKLRHLSPGALKEGFLQRMSEEMHAGSSQFDGFYWQVRTAPSTDDSFVTSDQPLLATVDAHNFADSFYRNSAVLTFPLSWDACLIGRRDPFALAFVESSRRERAELRNAYFLSATKFIVSAKRLS